MTEKHARKDHKDGTKKEGSLTNTINIVQDIWKHVSYGKHNNEYEEVCKELNITEQNTPLTFSDTWFSQYAYFVLRNFRHSYQALLQQLQSENIDKQGKENHIVEMIENASSIEFVVELSGALDIYRIEQILSQQSQVVDQQIYEVYDNIKKQRDNLISMAEELNLSDKNIPVIGN